MPTSVALGFVYVMFNAVARPALMASLAAVPDAVRGTVMGLNVTGASVGWLSAAGLGGIMMANYGFGSFGPLTAAISLVTAIIALWGAKKAVLF
ncbi:MAG: hypothetical protein NT133_14135, partial [Alphaproteobacteria bacterium]|nr:hypothetical protein [Alphaproteobacteria bacterium]